MSKSITYYITLLVIRLKRIKKKFSEDPINYLELRREDISFPKEKFFTPDKVECFVCNETKITQLKKKTDSNKLIIYIHGGAFISGPSLHHWETMRTIARSTNHTVWMCDYPKAPEHKISSINSNIDRVFKLATEKYKAENIILTGDSAGGTLIISLIQRLIENKLELPSKIILISPVLDASLENPEIDELNKKDPMLSKKGVLSAKRMCADDGNLKNKNISPLYGNFEGFPATYMFIAENDITRPDQTIMCNKLKEANTNHHIFWGRDMPHIWPILPVMKEAKHTLNKILNILNTK